MKALKKLALAKIAVGGLMAATMAVSVPAIANDRSSYARNDSITVRLNFNDNGDGRLPLKRLLRNQHGINADNWNIRQVNVRHRSNRRAVANLAVGSRSTGPVFLRRGTTVIAAPRGRNDGVWSLGYRNAKVRDVAVILEPRSNRNLRFKDNARSNRYERSYRTQSRSFGIR